MEQIRVLLAAEFLSVSVCLSVSLSFCLSLSLSVSVCLSRSSVCLSVCLFFSQHRLTGYHKSKNMAGLTGIK